MEYSTFSRQSILDRVMGDAEIANQICEMVKEDLPTFLKDLTKQIQDRDLNQAVKTAHKLKGIAGNIGADNLMNTAKDLEEILLGSPDTASLEQIDLTLIEEQAKKVLEALN
jgi:HPt (histidine-containing phosphotransfer) domain-containing protein